MHNLKVFSNFNLEFFLETEVKCELYVDKIPDSPKTSIRILWMIEPPEIYNIQNIVIKNKDEFDLILCWQQNILEHCNNAKLFPYGTSWVSNFDINLKKEYCVTSVVGGKSFTPNQRLRQELPTIVEKINSVPIQLFNSSHNPFTGEPKIKKFISQGPFKNDLFYSQFHIVIENSCHTNWFTEKLIDCFQTKTVPIYLGCPNISEFFDIRGMIIVSSIDEIVSVCKKINETSYSEILEFININYELSFRYSDHKKSLEREIKTFLSSEKK